jgi:hypothetical protein
VPLFPLALQGNLSPLGINPAVARTVDPEPERGPLWVHTLNAATHRLALERLAIPSPVLTALPHAVVLHHSMLSPGIAEALHTVQLHQSEQLLGLATAAHRLELGQSAIPSPGLTALPHTIVLHRSASAIGLTTATHSMRIFRSEPGNDDPC